jgi:hypothetical protein
MDLQFLRLKEGFQGVRKAQRYGYFVAFSNFFSFCNSIFHN